MNQAIDILQNNQCKLALEEIGYVMDENGHPIITPTGEPILESPMEVEEKWMYREGIRTLKSSMHVPEPNYIDYWNQYKDKK